MIAFLGFALSFIVHILTYFGVDLLTPFPVLWGLHIGIFIVFIPMVLSNRQHFGQRQNMKILFAPIPQWPRVLVGVLFVYAIINFTIFFFLSKGGTPAIEDGRYVLQNHGQFIRALTADEFHWQHVYIARGFSGHWLLFYIIPALNFWFPRPIEEGEKSEGVV